MAGGLLPMAIVGAVLVLIVPLPTMLLDILLAANITLSVLVLLTTLAIGTPRQFSSFPTVLLASALFRLVLNVASTRLILSKGGDDGLDAAGGVIRAFGEFVAGGSDQVIVGAILFVILVVIQFVVITKGTNRISEVAARFMLDGLPGRQMAIDADLHAGVLDRQEAQRRREDIYRQADFFAAMDGAGKYVRGDAVAALTIACINIVGGLALGIFQHGMSFGEAIHVFTQLTIGDGLASQVPAFLTSLAAGLIVTRSTSESHLGGDLVRQLLGRAEVLTPAALLLFALSLTPLPKTPLILLGLGLLAIAWVARSRESIREGSALDESASVESPAPAAAVASPTLALTLTAAEASAGDRIDDLLRMDPLELEIGYRLIPLAESNGSAPILEGVRQVRDKLARELGLIIPQMRIRDDLGLGPFEYRFKLRGSIVGQGVVYLGRLMAVPIRDPEAVPHGRAGINPLTGERAVWIQPQDRELAELAGCRLADAGKVVVSHFREIAMRHADEILTRSGCERLLEHARSRVPSLVAEVIPGLMRLGEFQKLLQHLLRERVSIRDLETILETVADHAERVKDIDALAELVRQSLGRAIVQQHRGVDGRLRAAILPRGWEDRLNQELHRGEFSPLGAVAVGEADRGPIAKRLGPDAVRRLIETIAQAVEPLIRNGHPPIVVCEAETRPVLRDLTKSAMPHLVVLSHREIPPDTMAETWDISALAAAGS